VVYRGLSASILRGERVGVIGPNGAGKSTLLRLVAGELRPDAGEVRLGHQVVPGYYAQHHFERGEGEEGDGRPFGALDPGRTVLDTLWDLVPDRGEAYVRGVAGSFLFSGDDVEKPIGVLSGGERARVALARILLVPANLLLLDEPTNHLDLESSEALIEALSGFEGTMLFVSHNRSFLNRLATRTWEVKAGGIVETPGNLDDWLYHQRQLAAAVRPSTSAGQVPPSGAAAGLRSGQTAPVPGPAGAEGRTDGVSRADPAARRRAEAEARNQRYRREKPIRDEIARLERRIEELEQAKKAAEAALADPALYQDFARARPHLDALSAANEELPELYQAWEARQGELGE
jgi:ATP-binding cassette subfamily F protein 3